MSISQIVATSRPQVVTTNLALYLDAYLNIGTGTTWNAIVGTNMDLNNSPTRNPMPTPSIGLDDTQSQSCSNNYAQDLSNWTIESWFQITSSLNNKTTAIICDQFNLTTYLNYSMGTNNSPTNYNLCIGFFDGSWHNTSGFSPNLNTWYHCAGTYNGSTLRQYVNGSLNSFTNYVGVSRSGELGTRIGRRWDGDTSSANFVAGNIGIVRIYSSALTEAQVIQNYTAEKSRFGY